VSDERLDQLAAELARTRPVLDDLTRARVAAQLEAARTAPAPAPPVPRRRIAIGSAVAAALAITAWLALPASGPRVAASATPPLTELPDGHLLATVRGTSARGGVAGAVLTLFGPGWAMRNDRRIVADAETLVVDRSAGDTPLELAVRAATIRVQSATFLVESAQMVRVTVMRGEVVLGCGGEVGRRIGANELASCDPAGSRSAQPLVIAAATAASVLGATVEPPAIATAGAAKHKARIELRNPYAEPRAIDARSPYEDAAARPAGRRPPRPIDASSPYEDGAAEPRAGLDEIADREREHTLGLADTPAFSAAATKLRALPARPAPAPTASPIFADGASSRLATKLRPLPFYEFLYDLPETARHNLAYYFAYDYKVPQDVTRYADPLVRSVHAWKTTWKHTELVSVDLDDRLFVFDTRPRAKAPVAMLAGEDRELFLTCDAITDSSALGASGSERLRAIAANGHMLNEGAKYLSLAVPVGEYQPSRHAMKRLRPLFAKLDKGDRSRVHARFTSVNRQPTGG